MGIDLQKPPEVPTNCRWEYADILGLSPCDLADLVGDKIDFIVASPPCEQFSVYGLKMWHRDPPFPTMGVKLFQHTQKLCEAAGVPHIIENVRSAQQFVGQAARHCGPFYLWGDAIPMLLHEGITKGSMIWSKRYRNMGKRQRKAEVATIPPELANCVADYAERLLEQLHA